MTRFLALIAATLLAFAAQAGDDKDKSHDTGMKSTATFDTLDKNADSQISKTEAVGRQASCRTASPHWTPTATAT